MHLIPRGTLRRVGAPLAVFAVLATAAAAQEWPQWRGPGRDGLVPGKVALAWPRALTPAWKVPIGIGYSSPVVSGPRVFTFAREGENEVAASLDLATGQAVWRESYPAPYTVNSAAAGHGKGPKSTPVVHGGRLYTLGIGGILSALDAATGRLLWRKDFRGQYRDNAPIYGTAMSPVVADGLLVAHVGGANDGALTAFGAERGDVRWAWKGDGPAYASPVVADVGGVRQVVTQTQKQLVGLSLSKGELLWSLPFTTPYEQNAVTPVVSGDVVVYSGLGQGLRAARIARTGGTWAAEPVWHNDEVSLYMSSPVLDGGRLFGFSHKNKGQFFAVDAATGKTLWVSEGRQGENAAVLAARAALLLLTNDGELIVAKKDARAFAPIATYTVADSATWAHPALVGTTLLVKDHETLAQWRIE
ncbi:MAG TPA: PQQ-binding-like beta-propeller repeat protein [Vicinamibacteria bacterium]|nr:PQQ-binding-like beta-propeller repeat protein [Vicinamibacteria bacterium]